ncbi:MAG: invasion associated locus B family protein [Pseudomonadota bacterium]
MRALNRSFVLMLSLIASASFGANDGVLAQASKKAPADGKQAAAPAPQAPKIPWIVNCASLTGKVNCEAVQRLTIKKTGQLLLGITVRLPEGAKDPTMMVQLPHGMFLPSGVSLTIDKNPKKQEPVQTCDAKGCYVGLALDAKLLKTMQSGTALAVSFRNLAKKEIKIPITLSGFAEAYKKLL